MNDVIHAMISRRSVRQFSTEPVPEELLKEIIETGLYAASAMGRQAPVILNVTDPEWQARIRKVNCEIGGWQPDFDPFYGAPAMLIVLAPQTWPNRVPVPTREAVDTISAWKDETPLPSMGFSVTARNISGIRRN